MIGIVPVIGLIVYNESFSSGSFDSTNIDKTIAVLPFVNDSSDDENLYFCNGIMAGIRDHLAKVSEFTVLSRRSVEKYRNDPTSLNVIAKELDVNYLVEGGVQRIGDRAIVSAELILAKENKVLWSESYDVDVSEVFNVQASVIESVTDKLQVIISPNLKIELTTEPTKDKKAYEYYLQGEEYRFKAYRPRQKTKVWLGHLDKARASFEMAIKQDSLYVPAYLSLAMTVWERNYGYTSDENNLDEVLILTNKALHLFPNSSLAYLIRGDYYRSINQNELAIKDYEKTLEIIPNNTSAMYSLINLYKGANNYKDAILILKKLEKFAKSRNQLIGLYNNYISFYRILEQHEMVDYYYNKKFEGQTTLRFDRSRVWSYVQSNRFDEGLKYTEESLPIDNQQKNGLLAYLYMRKKDFSKALQYYKKCYKQVQTEGINSMASTHLYSGYGKVLFKKGEIEKGKEMIQKQISLNNKMINSKRVMDKPLSYLSNIACYAYLGEYKQVYDNINKFELHGWVHYEFMVTWVKDDFAYDLLRDDPIFKAWIKRGEQHLIKIQKQIRPQLPLTPPN